MLAHYYPIFALLSVKWSLMVRLKRKRKFQTFIYNSESDYGCLILREVVADERWLQLEVQLYCLNAFKWNGGKVF